MKIFYYVSYNDYHFNVSNRRILANRRILDRVRLMLWISYRNFSFHHAIRFRPVERIVARVLPHSKLFDDVEAEFHFHVKTYPLRSTGKFHFFIS